MLPRCSLTDTVFGSLDRSTGSRLATPGDFRLPAATNNNNTVSGSSSNVHCDDLRRGRTPKKMSLFGTLVERGGVVLRPLSARARMILRAVRRGMYLLGIVGMVVMATGFSRSL